MLLLLIRGATHQSHQSRAQRSIGKTSKAPTAMPDINQPGLTGMTAIGSSA
jgi:hypothetical protein